MQRRRTYIIVAVILLSILFFSTSKYAVSVDGVLRGVKPFFAWEFVMDFNNVKELNPTIIDFTILSDGSHGDEWQYEVEYREFLHQLPFITNYAVALYRFKSLSDKEFVIFSVHKTCFLGNITCVHSKSEFIFRQDRSNPDDTYCRETVHYECPRILSSFCFREVMFQRKAIFENLEKSLSQSAN